MRQKAFLDSKPITKGEKLLRKWLTGKEEAPFPDRPAQIIPESLIVPMAALHQHDSNWIESQRMFSSLEDPAELPSTASHSDLLQELIRRHDAEFKNWAELGKYRDTFLIMQGEVASD